MIKMKKIIALLFGLLFNCTAHATTFQLVGIEQDEPDEDSPVATIYTYTALKPLIVSYRYGFNLDLNKYELAIKFSDSDAINTPLRSVYLSVMDDDQQFLKRLNITDFKPKQGCYYLGKAEIRLDEVWVATFEFGGSDYGSAYLRDLKALDATPRLACA